MKFHTSKLSVAVSPGVRVALDNLARLEGSSASAIARRAINCHVVDAELYQTMAAQARYDFAYADAGKESRKLEEQKALAAMAQTNGNPGVLDREDTA